MDIQIEFWDKIHNSSESQDFKNYLQKYPNGYYVDLAKAKIRQLQAATIWNAVARTSLENPAKSIKTPAGIGMVWIPPGSFTMGPPEKDPRSTALKPHVVTLGRGFYMGRYEVTQAQWQGVVGTTVNQQRIKSGIGWGLRGEGNNYPMYYVSWNEAQDFIEKLNERNDGYFYRLPSEAEWEYACRAGTSTDFAFGDSITSDQATFIVTLGDYDTHGTRPVGSFKPNAWGLYDMHGNVWEWCQDWYHDDYTGAPTDGSPWLTGGEQEYLVLRGGSWRQESQALRSWVRFPLSPGHTYIYENDVGFRLVAVPRTQ